MPETLVRRARTQDPAAVRRGNGPGGRALEKGEDIPLTPEQSVRLGELFEAHNSSLVHYARRKLMTMRGLSNAEADGLAEDIAQEAWVDVARTGAKNLLARERMDMGAERRLLFATVKDSIHRHFRRASAAEQVVDWQDPVTCNALCPLASPQCRLADLPGYLARMVAALPVQHREALCLSLDGVPRTRIAEHLGLKGSQEVSPLVRQALVLLQIDNPELCADPVPLRSLPRWEREDLGCVSPAQREALLRLDAEYRRVLLLQASRGWGCTRISSFLEISRSHVARMLSGCGGSVRRLAAEDVAVAA